MLHRPLMAVAVLLLLLLICVTSTVLAGVLGRPERWEFPAELRGWVVVQYNNASCPPLSGDGIYLVVSVPISGFLCTSSDPPQGWVYARYTSVDPDEQTARIPAGDNGGPRNIVMVWELGTEGDGSRQYYFIGTRDELDQSWDEKPYRFDDAPRIPEVDAVRDGED